MNDMASKYLVTTPIKHYGGFKKNLYHTTECASTKDLLIIFCQNRKIFDKTIA